MPLSDGEGWQNIQVTVQDAKCRLRKALRYAAPVSVHAACAETITRSCLLDTGDGANGQTHSEHLHVMVIHLVAQPGLANLTETMKLIEADRISIRHDQAMKKHGKTLLAETV